MYKQLKYILSLFNLFLFLLKYEIHILLEMQVDVTYPMYDNALG